MQARLQVWSGSSISTTGTRVLPAHQFLSCHFIMSVAMCSGYRMQKPPASADRRDDGPFVHERRHPGAEQGRENRPQPLVRDASLARQPSNGGPEPGTHGKASDGTTDTH